MWSESETPALSIEQLAKLLGKSVRDTKQMMEDYWRIKNGRAEQIEKKAAEFRHRRGPMRVNEEMGDARPEISMSRIRWLQLHRASMTEKHDRGGSLLSEDSDFIPWLLKRSDMEHLRVALAKTTNRQAYTSAIENAVVTFKRDADRKRVPATPKVENASTRLANAADWGRRERAGTTIRDPQTGGYVTAIA